MIRVQNNPLKWTLSIYFSFSFSLFFHFDPHFEILYHKVNFVFTFHFFSIKWHGFKQFSVQKKISDCLKKKQIYSSKIFCPRLISDKKIFLHFPFEKKRRKCLILTEFELQNLCQFGHQIQPVNAKNQINRLIYALYKLF